MYVSCLSLDIGCEEITPVHLRSVHPSSVHANARQLPRDDLGDCERPRAQNPLWDGQAHPFPQRGLVSESLQECLFISHTDRKEFSMIFTLLS